MIKLPRLSLANASWLTLGLAACVFAPLVTYAQSSSQSEFPDVEPSYWAQPFITNLAARNILSGYPDGKFRPQQAIDRDEFAAVIRKAFEQKDVKQIASGSVYKDVPQDYWANPAIEEAVESGFMSGTKDGLFKPRQEVSKLEAINALTRGLGLTAQGATTTAQVPTTTTVPVVTSVPVRRAKPRRRSFMLPMAMTTLMQPLVIQKANAARAKAQQPNGATTQTTSTATTTSKLTPSQIIQQTYQDAEKIPENSVNSVAAATVANVVVNYPNQKVLNPDQAISRGETAALVYQTLVKQGKLQPIADNSAASEYIVRFEPTQKPQ